ncbi:MAG: hypothetical protein JSV03_04415 [Planctomycetota bacterium]|nr:MAG: hypothetical protein JSV03_04415 [Planctomycetota bacterium]
MRRIQEIYDKPAVGQDPAETWTEREYIYGPDYVDEFVLQVDDPWQASPQTIYILQDANYNVVALLDDSGSLLAQYTYEPYGTRVAAEEPGMNEYNENAVGHQGLFFYRLNTGASPLSPSTTGLYYNRNRWYSPELGRFIQRDPNESGMLVASAAVINGEVSSTLLGYFDSYGHYVYGMNLYTYLDVDPVNNSDPLGLSLEDDIDDLISDVRFDYAVAYSTTLAATRQIKKGVRTAMLYAAIAFEWDKFVWEQGEGALFGILGGAFFANACFDADTQIWMSDGSYKPIDEIQIGDLVMCDYDPWNNNGPECCEVVETFQRSATELLDIEFVSQAGIFVITTTLEHPFYLPNKRGFVPAKDLDIGDRLVNNDNLIVDILSINHRHKEIDVYNFEVKDVHNYFVGSLNRNIPILVHNACSAHQVNKLIRTGKAPKTIKIANSPRIAYEKKHIHFFDGTALNFDGTWKHGKKILTNAEKVFIKMIGWSLPK